MAGCILNALACPGLVLIPLALGRGRDTDTGVARIGRAASRFAGSERHLGM